MLYNIFAGTTFLGISVMNKTFNKTIALLMIAAFAGTNFVYANPIDGTPDAAYSFTAGPENVYNISQTYRKPVEMMDILPGRPVSAHTQSGSSQYFSPKGELMLSVATDGTRTYSLKGGTKKYDKDGNLISETTRITGTDLEETKNDSGQVTGYTKLGYGGQVVAELDKDKNVERSYVYDKYGKNLEYVLNENTMVKTVYGKNGKATYDMNYEGAKTAWYNYNKDGNIESKTDIQQNVTLFDKNGNMKQTTDWTGSVVLKYNYKTDDNGNSILDTSVDKDGNITTYKNNNPLKTVSSDGSTVMREWKYEGNTLIYSHNNANNEITWYDAAGKSLYSSIDDFVTAEWMYSKGKLVGTWSNTTSTLTVYINNNRVATYQVSEKPSADVIQGMIDSGEIKQEYTDGERVIDTNGKTIGLWNKSSNSLTTYDATTGKQREVYSDLKTQPSAAEVMELIRQADMAK